MGRKSSVDIDQLKALHKSGMGDQEIAKQLGVTANAVGFQRRKLGLASNGKRGRRGKPSNARAAAATAGQDFKKAPELNISKAPTNGAGQTVQVRVEVLDAMWAGLEPEDKARLVNHLIEARGR